MQNRSSYVHLVKDLMVPNAAIYWCDFLASLTLLYASFFALALLPPSWLITPSVIVIGSLFFYRCASFLHEIVHRGRRQLPGFSAAYNVLFGYAFKLPIFLYTPHLDHHSLRKFTTSVDPEYTRWSQNPVKDFTVYTLGVSFVFPILLAIRLGVVPILSPFLGYRVRDWILRKASTLATQRGFERRIRFASELRSIRIQEAMCAIYNAALLVLIAFQILSWEVIAHWYSMAVLASAINAFRASINHGYKAMSVETTFNGMIRDSFNVTGRSFWQIFWGPLDTQFHCLHHMFPTIPYHSLRKAHARLMANLPLDHPYRQSNKESYSQAFHDLIWTREVE